MHIPVLLKEALGFWVGNPDGFYVDLTLGCAGHSLELLKTYPQARLLGIDWDSESLKIAQDRLRDYQDRVTFKRGNFADIGKILESLNIPRVDGFLFDLGPSSYQILERSLGLSFSKDEPLDMRINSSIGSLSAASLLANSNAQELSEVFREFGELSFGFSRRLASTIQNFKQSEPIQTTGDLTRCLSKITTNRKLWAQAFQALRIIVNREIDNIQRMLSVLPSFSTKGARIVGISFHSLEDRLLKQTFALWKKEGLFRPLSKKPVSPSTEEIHQNPRARSAKLRVVEKQ